MRITLIIFLNGARIQCTHESARWGSHGHTCWCRCAHSPALCGQRVTWRSRWSRSSPSAVSAPSWWWTTPTPAVIWPPPFALARRLVEKETWQRNMNSPERMFTPSSSTAHLHLDTCIPDNEKVQHFGKCASLLCWHNAHIWTCANMKHPLA